MRAERMLLIKSLIDSNNGYIRNRKLARLHLQGGVQGWSKLPSGTLFLLRNPGRTLGGPLQHWLSASTRPLCTLFGKIAKGLDF